ncbi:Shedu anti-phage system protein SduA domain-containing protein [Streptomyces sp. SM1P]
MKYWILTAENKSAAYAVARGAEKLDMTISAVSRADAEVGDAVLLWRGGRGGGLVALGEVSKKLSLNQTELYLHQMRVRREGKSEVNPVRVTLDFHKLLLSSPISEQCLKDSGFQQIVKAVRSKGVAHDLREVDFSNSGWMEFNKFSSEIQNPNPWPSMWNISSGSVVRRGELHSVYGGNHLVKASSSGRTPNAFLFLEAGPGSQESCRFLQSDGSVLLAPGQGQDGYDPSMENLAALAHVRRGTPLRVFISRNSECLYIGEFAIDSKRPIQEWVAVGERSRRWDKGNVRVIREPVLRLRQLSGISFGVIDEEIFRNAPRITLGLHPSSDARVGGEIRRLLDLLEGESGLATSLGSVPETQLLAIILQRTRRQDDLNELRAAVEDSRTKESDLQKIIQRMTWIFGSEFDPGTVRRNLTLRDQLDLALVRPDGTLHGVELKKANIKKLVTSHRSHLIPGPEVHQAICQANNYLRELDEHRSQILADLGIDCRRASMTVVIGHTNFVGADVTRREVGEVMRTYNSDRSRVTVTTYDQLIENAQRSIDLTMPES